MKTHKFLTSTMLNRGHSDLQDASSPRRRLFDKAAPRALRRVARLMPFATACLFACPTFKAQAGSSPVIISQPSSQTVFYGDPVSFQAQVSGTAPTYYQWSRNGFAVTSATSSALALSTVSSNDQGAGFYVTVTNSYGSATSLVAVLTVDYGVAGLAQSNHLLSFGSVWKYDQADNLDGVNWTAPSYDDSAWPTGPGLLAFENNSLITPLIGTTLADPRVPPPGLGSGHAYISAPT